MPHRRIKGSKRKFEDGTYRFLSSHINKVYLDAQLRRYSKVTHNKLRTVRSRDGKYHIYEKMEE